MRDDGALAALLVERLLNIQAGEVVVPLAVVEPARIARVAQVSICQLAYVEAMAVLVRPGNEAQEDID